MRFTRTAVRITAILLAGSALIALNSPPGPGSAMATDTSGTDQPKADHTVILTNIEFKPNRVKVAAGDTIRFINHDKFDHDVYLVRTANRNDVLHAATTIHPGQSVTVKIDQQGLFTLYCTIHGGMTGKVTTTGTFELTEAEKKRAAAHKVIPPIVKTGEALYWGRAQCHRCHMVGTRGTGLRGPNHQDLGFRARARAAKLGLESATAYIVQSIMEPSAHIVEGYTNDMPRVYQAPINLNESDIKAIVAYLQSQGGDVDTWSINISKVQLARTLPPSPFAHGDPHRGARVFEQTGCGSCHTVGARKAISIAPDLTAIGAYRNWTWLAEAITDPNAEIGANWRGATVYLKPGAQPPTQSAFQTGEFLDDDDEFEDEGESTDQDQATSSGARSELDAIDQQIAALQARREKLEQTTNPTGTPLTEAPTADRGADAGPAASEPTTVPADAQASSDAPENGPPEGVALGARVSGVLRRDGPDGVTLLTAPDHLEVFPRDQVAAVVLNRDSRMAANFGELLTFDQLADLISYLESLKGAPPDQTPSNHVDAANPPH